MLRHGHSFYKVQMDEFGCATFDAIMFTARHVPPHSASFARWVAGQRPAWLSEGDHTDLGYNRFARDHFVDEDARR